MGQINLGYNESVDIVLPNGKKVSVLLGYLEPGEQLPEIDIMLPDVLTLNCFGEGLSNPHTHDAKQIIIPIAV